MHFFVNKMYFSINKMCQHTWPNLPLFALISKLEHFAAKMICLACITKFTQKHSQILFNLCLNPQFRVLQMLSIYQVVTSIFLMYLAFCPKM